jgi:hypothetical protein
MSKTIDAQSARSIAAKAACGDNSVRNYYAGKPMRSCTEFRIRKAIIELGGEGVRSESVKWVRAGKSISDGFVRGLRDAPGIDWEQDLSDEQRLRNRLHKEAISKVPTPDPSDFDPDD